MTCKLNLGCGTNILKGYINVDCRMLPGVDVVSDLLSLPFNENSVDEVLLEHTIEHFTYSDAKKCLAEIYRVLKPGGILVLACPNFQGLAFLYSWLFGKIYYEWGGARLPTPTLYPPITGLQDYKENVHLSQWSYPLITHYIINAGFQEVSYSRKKLPKILQIIVANVLIPSVKYRFGNIFVCARKGDKY